MHAIVFVLSLLALGIAIAVAWLYLTDPTPDAFVLDRARYPFQSQFMDLPDGSRLHYLDEGRGQTLLLLHGNPTWSFLYRQLIHGLKDEYRLIVPDYPGFGLSTASRGFGFTAAEQAQVVGALVEKLDLQDALIMMQDWGGPIGFKVALQQPERFKGFVIGNTWAWPLERRRHKLFSMVMGGWPGQLGAWCCNGVVRAFMSRGVAGQLGAPELAMYLGPFSHPKSRSPTHIFPAQLREASDFLGDVYRKLPRLSDRPVLLLWGEKDFAFQQPERDRFESLFPHHDTVLLEGAGHFIQEDAPEAIVAAIRDWSKKTFSKRDERL